MLAISLKAVNNKMHISIIWIFLDLFFICVDLFLSFLSGI